jgi:hypothetical protein
MGKDAARRPIMTDRYVPRDAEKLASRSRAHPLQQITPLGRMTRTFQPSYRAKGPIA